MNALHLCLGPHFIQIKFFLDHFFVFRRLDGCWYRKLQATAFAEKVKKTEKENVSKPPDKRVKSRAASKCSGEVEAIWGSFWGELPSKLRFSVAIPECTSAAPQFLGVQAGAVACGAEPDGLASWRLVLEGTRTVVAAPVAAMADIFGHQDPSKYWKLLLDIDQVNLDKIVGCGGLHFCDLWAERDVLFTLWMDLL